MLYNFITFLLKIQLNLPLSKLEHSLLQQSFLPSSADLEDWELLSEI